MQKMHIKIIKDKQEFVQPIDSYSKDMFDDKIYHFLMDGDVASYRLGETFKFLTVKDEYAVE